MAPITVVLNTSAPVLLDGAGNGTAQIGPIHQREVWTLAAVAVQVSSNIAEALCEVFCGPDASSPYFVGTTLSGSTGDSTSDVAGRTVSAGEYVFAVWTGGDPGAQGRMVVTGSKVLS